MAGTYTEGEKKIIPGVYSRYTNVDRDASNEVINGVGAGLIRANWGPLNEVVTFETGTVRTLNRVYGSGQTEDLVSIMFAHGTNTGHFVRIGTGGSVPSIKLQDDQGTDCVQITGAYVGKRAFTVSIRDSLVGGDRECIIYEGTTEFLKVKFGIDGAEADGLIAAINAATADFIATSLASGGVMATVTQSPLTGGANPTTTVSEYSAGLDILEAYDYNVVCVDTTDAAVHALVHAFLDRTFEAGALPMTCIAEDTSIPLATRMANAAAFDDEKVVYCLNGAADSKGTPYDGYRLAAAIGGEVATIATTQSLTHKIISGFASVTEPLTNTEMEKALKSGCIALATNRAGNVLVKQGINTLINLADNQDDGWKKIRRVKTRFELQRRLQDEMTSVIGKVDCDSNGIATIIAKGQGIINTMISEGKLITGEFSQNAAYPATSNSVWFSVGAQDKDSAEFVYQDFNFSFTAE